MGAQEVHFPALLPREPYDKQQPLDRVRRRRVPAQGPQGRRLHARADPRGVVHPARQGPVLVVQGPAAVDLPDPDQVPRRAAAAGRAAARPRVRDEGLLLLRRRRRRPGRSYAAHREAYIRIFDRLGLDYVIVSALSGAMGGSKSEEFLTPGRGRRGHLRPVHDLRLRRQRRGAAHPGRRRRQPYDDVPAAHVEDTPDTPTIETLVALANSRDDLRRDDRDVDRRRHAEERRGQARARPRARPSCSPSAVPGRPRGRRQAARGRRAPGGRRAVHRGGLRGHPGPGPRLHRARGSRRRQARGRALPARPARRRGHPLDHRRQRARSARLRPGGRPRLHRRRHHRGGLGVRGRPVPERRRRHPGHRPRHRDGPHLPARPQVRRRARPQGARRERQAGRSSRWAPTASASRARSPRSPRRPYDDIGLCWPRAVAPADVHVVATGKDDAVLRGRAGARRTTWWRRG